MIELLALFSFIAGVIIRYSFNKYHRFRSIVNKYLMYFGLPLMVLIAVHERDLASLGYIALVSFLIGLLLILTSFIIIEFTRFKDRDKASLFLCSAFGNTAFLGIPLGYIVFGNTGALIAGILSFIMMLFRYSLGLFLSNSFVSKRLSFKKYVSKPFIWLLLAAFIIAQFNYTIPEFFVNFSSLTVLIAVLVVGLSLDVKELNLKNGYLSLLKLVLAPLIVLPLIIVSETPYILEFLFLTAMPSAFLNTALALEYNFNNKLASGLTTMGTLIFAVMFGIFTIITTL